MKSPRDGLTTGDPVASMTPLTFQILLALADDARHGYGIIKEIEERAGGSAAPSTGAMYLALQRMETSGLIEDAKKADGADARRRYYRLTHKGFQEAEAESMRLAHLVRSARDKNLLIGDPS
jgi:DNA-binding PadR family transcriptional regulator